MRPAALLVALALVPAPALADAPSVALADAARTIADAIAKIDARTAVVGESLVIASIAPLDPAKPVDTAPLRAELARRKLKVIDDRTHGISTVITVEGAAGARARIAVDQGGGAIVMTARPRVAKLAGRCVRVPQVQHAVYVHSSAIDQMGEHREGSTFWDFKTERIHDVDGDGILDAFVPIAKRRHACPEEVAFRVFAMRGGCGHDLGVIGPGSFAWDAGTVALDASGFRPFTMEAQTSEHGKRGIPELATTVRRFAVRRGKYRQIDVKRTSGACHHCATWHCNAK